MNVLFLIGNSDKWISGFVHSIEHVNNNNI